MISLLSTQAVPIPAHTSTPLLYQQLPCRSQRIFSPAHASTQKVLSPGLSSLGLGPYSMPPDPKAFWNHLQKILYTFMNAGTCCCLPHCSPCPWASFSCQMSLAEFIHVSLLVEWKLHGKRVSVNIPTVQNSARNLLKTLFKINEQLGITRTVYPF